MAEPAIAEATVQAIRAGGEALDRGERGPAREIDLLRDAGLLTAPLPPAAGGRGWGTRPAGAAAICEVLMTLGGASLPIARLYEGHVNAVRLVGRYGDAAQVERIAEAVGGGALLGVWGADSERPVSIEDGPGGPSLRGAKAFASGLGDVAIAVVTAGTGDGLQMVLVAADDPARADHAAWDVAAMVGSRSGRFDCDGLPADRTRRLGPADALFGEPDFHGGIWRLVACYAGALARLAVLGGDWLRRRGTLVDPIALARLGAIVLEAETGAMWARHAAAIAEAAEPSAADAVAAALFAREAIEHAAARLLGTIERLMGTAIHRRDSEAGRLARDLRFYLRQADLDGKLAMATGHWLDRGPVTSAAQPPD